MAASAENDCGCTNISIMQLFHELKQKFPAVPDRVVSECIRQNFHDKGTCEAILSRENATYLLHSYPPSLKMSSSESESALSAKFQNLSLCDKCSLGRPCCSSDSFASQVVENTPLSRNLNVTGAHFQKEESSLFSHSSNTQVIPSDNLKFLPPHSDKKSVEENSVQRSSKCHYTEAEKCANTSEVLCQGITSNNSQVLQECASLSSSVLKNSKQFSPSDMWLTPQREDTLFPHKWFSGNSEPHLRPSPAVLPSGNTASFMTAHKSCSRLTSLNVDYSNFQHQPQVQSTPVISSNFEPFQSSSNNNNNNSSSSNNNNNLNRPSPGSAGHNSGHVRASPVGANQGVGPSTWQSEPNINNCRNNASGNNSADVHEGEDCRRGDRTVVNSYQVNVNCSLNSGRTSSTVNVSGSTTRTVTDNREPHPKARSVIHLQPAPHYAGQNYWGGDNNTTSQTPGSVSTLPQQPPRSYTSVNLTLRPPSSEPQPPIDIHSGGTSLMYSTSSYDPNQGYRSKLQICIGPGGAGSVSAMRTQVHEPGRAPQVQPQVPQFVPTRESLSREEPLLEVLRPTSSLAESTTGSTTSSESTSLDHLEPIHMDHLPVATQTLLQQQLERKNRLQLELKREKERLRVIIRSAREMEQDLAQRLLTKKKALPAVSTVVQKVQRLKEEIRKLTEECEKMTHEVDKWSDAGVPLGETDEEFYKNIYTGQQGYVGTRPSSRDAPPHRPDPVRQDLPPDSDGREGRSWTCSECTFQNYWELNYCEQCDMPRIVLAGETQDIHIHVTHHNFPIRNHLLVGS
ncbi:TGF-beta-activated kinase 1 and MAP3K7-binding protein 2 isoform X2 [Anabrus simplex]|uniref:TGF-beta-activated kinase 1 and MAP3K7-binding protein 2 isoform X2 n=1 Tax=Anabrus simplex TaxID=316456 RepID=UPI0035A3221F